MVITVVGKAPKAISIEKFLPKCVTKFIIGGSKQTDPLVENYALENGIDIQGIYAQKYKRGFDSYDDRDKKIASAVDMVILLWDGKAKSIEKIATYASQLGKIVRVFVMSGR